MKLHNHSCMKKVVKIEEKRKEVHATNQRCQLHATTFEMIYWFLHKQ